MRKNGKLIGRLPDGKEIRWASREQVEEHPYELEDILGIIGHPEAIVTDVSSTNDFFSDDENEAINAVLQKIADHFGIDTPKGDERFVDIASRARSARKRR